MKFNIYSVFDRVSHLFGELFLAQNHALAERRFQYTAKNAPMVCDDLALYCLGTYDTLTGEIIPSNDFVCAYKKDGD